MSAHIHRARRGYYVAPEDDPNDVYAADYGGNEFETEAEAEAAIPELRAIGSDWDHEWVVVPYSSLKMAMCHCGAAFKPKKSA